MPQTWLIIGATRGIGLEFTTKLLSLGHTVIATARSSKASIASSSSPSIPPGTAGKLWSLTGARNGHNLTILECDVSNEGSIKGFTEQIRKLGQGGGVLERGVIDVVVLNAGILEYPGRVSETSSSFFAHHITTNTIGPLLTASHLLSLSTPSSSQISNTLSSSPSSALPPATSIHTRTLVFISSDSGSAGNFRAFEDGFGVYSASKAALNQGLRHLAAEIHRKRNSKPKSSDVHPTISPSPMSIQGIADKNNAEMACRKTVVLALHPGEVATDMATNVSLDWEVEGIMGPEESVRCMLKVIEEKGCGGTDEGGMSSAVGEGRKEEPGAATFWTWDGRNYPW